MTLNFPAAPASGATHNATNGLQYTYDGVKWTSQGAYATGLKDVVKLDSIASQFNGSLTSFTLTNNSVGINPLSAESLTISLGGVIQEPQTAYTVNSATGVITFTSAPAAGTTFYGVLQSRLPVNTAAIGTLGDGAVSTEGKLANGVVTEAKLGVGAVTETKLGTGAVTETKLGTGSITNAKVNSAAAIDSTKLSFTQTGTGADARTVDSKLKDTLHFKDFGAVGDGSTNDAVPLLEALNAATGRVLDGGGLTYKCNSMLAPTSENIVVQNATFDFSGVTATGNTANAYISFTGSVGTPTAVSADINVGANTFTVASTSGLTTPNSYHILEDDQVVTSSEGLTLGQYIFIKEVNTTSKLVTLHNDILYKFLSASNAQVVPVTMKKNITFRNVIIKGANPAGTTTSNTHTGLRFRRCEGVTVENCTLEDIDYAGSVIDASVNVKISNCTCKHHTKTGTSYGFVIGNGSYGVNIVNSYGQDLRHFVTIGDNEGINLFINVTNCHVSGCRDAGIDSHSGGDFVNFSGNTIEGSSFDSGMLDGIIFQGINCIINDNVIVGIRRHAIHHQPILNFAAASGGTASSVISGNKIINHGDASSNEAGVLVFNHSNVLGTIDGVVIANNIMEGTSNTGISIYASGGPINNVSITGNNINHSNVQGILLRSGTDSGETIKNFNITGNIVNAGTATGPEGIYMFGNSTCGISNGTVTGNVVDMKDPASSGTHANSSTAIRLDHTDHTVVSSNIVVDAKVFINPTSATSDNVYANNIDNSPDN